MKKNISLILMILSVALLMPCYAQSTFDLSTVASWQELPTSTQQWKAGNYKVTKDIVISSPCEIPANSSICITGNGSITVKNATMTMTSGSAMYVVGGKLSLTNSSLHTGKGCLLTEGELGSINLSNSTINLGESSLLTINGKMIDGNNSKIEGNASSLQAPIKKIFAPGISVEGKWVLDRAYPQWFEDSKTANWAVAINKAITMKGTGEVFLPRGEYSIASTIFVKFGIALVGEAGRQEPGKNTYSTSLIPSKGKNNFNGGYMMLVNVKHNDSNGKEIEVSQHSATWEIAYPNAGTMLKNLTFNCNGSQHYKAILMAGGVIIDQLSWYGCLQAVAATDKTYDDQRIITNCSFHKAGNIKQSREVLYAFDLNSLGDALVFTGNAVHNVDNYTKALRVAMCDGGSITSNILNGDILFDQCKGITFSSNHCENGATVTIKASTIVNNANFYEKGTKPSIIITNNSNMQNSVVTINGDQFVYYNGVRSDNPHESPDVTADRLRSISENDIAIDQQSQLTLNDVYRYDVPMRIGIGKQDLFGIQVATINKNGKYEPNKSFNRYSHQLSQSGDILKNNKVNKPGYGIAPGKSHIYLYGKNTATWFGETGDYTYSYQIIDNNGKVTNSSDAMSSYTEKKTTIHLEKGDYGVLLCLAGSEMTNNRFYVRMQRRGADGTKTVEFPTAGTEHIYDNGISIAGYKWK